MHTREREDNMMTIKFDRAQRTSVKNENAKSMQISGFTHIHMATYRLKRSDYIVKLS